jgi:cytochrome c oxidase cbb3-type subunit 4
MDVNDLRSLVTLLSFLLFLALVVWTLAPARRRAHEEAAQLVFEGELPPDVARHDAVQRQADRDRGAA